MLRLPVLRISLVLLAAAGAAAAHPAPPAAPVGPPAPAVPVGPPAPPAPVSPAVRLLDETHPVRLRDSRGAEVTLRVPAALHRPANRFRLYGARPLTLRDFDRRRELYRDAFLELATRSRLAPPATAWDSLSKQWEWLSGRLPRLAVPSRLPALSLPAASCDPAPPPGAPAPDEVARAVRDAVRQVRSLPGYRHVESLGRALGEAEPKLDAAEPVQAALQLRALATDEAEQRLAAVGRAIDLEAPGTDPALREGYWLARAEFDEVRRGLWPAVGAAVRRSQGRLLLSAVRRIVLSHLGIWAIFGYIGWQAAEGALNAEHRGQFAVCLAGAGAPLVEAAARLPEHLPLALYAEFALNYQLTEALKAGQLLPLQAAGGRSVQSWQLHCSARCEDLRRSLAAAPPPAGAVRSDPPSP